MSGGDSAAHRGSRLWLASILVVAAVLRLYPAWFGLPYPHARPDEETTLGHAIGVLTGDPNPHFFHWPSLIFYVLAGVFRLVSLTTPGGALPSNESLLITARVVVALAGTTTVFVLYLLVRDAVDRRTGLIAALFLAVAVLHVRDSHFATTDVLMTLLVVVSVWILIRAVDAPTLGTFAGAGFIAGLATGTKYSAAAVVATMAAAQVILLRRERRGSGRALTPSIVYAAACVGGFAIATPYALLDVAAFRNDLAFEFSHLSGGHAGVDLGRGWSAHLLRSIPYGAGLTIVAAALVGVLPLLRHHRQLAIVLGSCAGAFYLALGSGTTVFFRYALPLIPLVCICAAVGVRGAAAWIAMRSGWPERRVLAAVIALAAGPVFVSSAWMDVLLARTDTRVVAADWLRERLRPQDTLHDAGTNYTRLHFGGTVFHDWPFDAASGTFGSAGAAIPDWLVLYDSPIAAYTSAPPALEHLAASRYQLVYTVEAGQQEDGLKRWPLQRTVYDLQDAFFLPISGFHTVIRPGPDVRIYRLSTRELAVSRSQLPVGSSQ